MCVQICESIDRKLGLDNALFVLYEHLFYAISYRDKTIPKRPVNSITCTIVKVANLLPYIRGHLPKTECIFTFPLYNFCHIRKK